MSMKSHSSHATSGSVTSANYGFPEEDLRQEGGDNPGYFPARLGQPLEGGRFCIVRKLGWGQYASVWLAKDRKEDRFVALKILTCESTKALQVSGAKQRSDEVRMLQKIAAAQPSHRGFRHNLALYDTFEFRGSHGIHMCLVTEVLGYSVDYIRKQNDDGDWRLSMALTKRITKQLLYSLEYLHDVCGIVHTDIKHDNILFRPSDVSAVVAHELAAKPSVSYDCGTEINPPVVPVVSQALPLSTKDSVSTDQLEAVLADVGHSHWKDRHFQELVQPGALRAPEIILGYPWGTSADIWNLGCIVTEFLIGFWLFEFGANGDKWNAEEDHLARMTEALGAKFDPIFLSKCKYNNKYFNADGSWKNFTSHEEPTWPLEELLAKFASIDLQEGNVEAATQFLRRCLQLNPEERASARELLEDPWLVDA
ncbi:kinase-like protein [Moniliophthora roreri]|nr:kinase-like protein [Moniliophthora roreri]